MNTNPEHKNFAWSSPKKSMQFTAELAKIHINGNSNQALNQRITDVLELMRFFCPINYASLWKIKKRANIASIMSRVGSYKPDPKIEKTEYNCPINDNHISYHIDKIYTLEALNKKKEEYYIFDVDDVSLLPYDKNFNTEIRISNLNTKRNIFVFFRVNDFESNRESGLFFLNICIMNKFSDVSIPNEFFHACIEKIKSGIRAIIHVKTNYITKMMTSVEIPERVITPQILLKKSLSPIFPDFLNAKYVGVIYSHESTGFVRGSFWDATGAIEQIPSEACEKLVEILDEKFNTHLLQNVIIPLSDFKPHLNIKLDEGNIIISKIQGSLLSNNRKGFFFSIGRINDFAKYGLGHPNFCDYFDWEDEIIVNHIARIVDLIFELRMATEHQLRIAKQVSHDLFTPTNYIFSTLERHIDALTGRESRARAMMISESRRMINASNMQKLLIKGLAMRTDDISLPKSKRYKIRSIGFVDIADTISKILIPMCLRHDLEPESFFISEDLPVLYFDKSACEQIFMNLFTNAIKYSDKGKKRQFSIEVQSRRYTLGTRALNLPDEYLIEAKKYGIETGQVISVLDNGIGMEEQNINRIFVPGVRLNDVNATYNQGAGIGLSIVASILKDFYSCIWVQQRKNRTNISMFFPDLLRNDDYSQRNEWHSAPNNFD